MCVCLDEDCFDMLFNDSTVRILLVRRGGGGSNTPLYIRKNGTRILLLRFWVTDWLNYFDEEKSVGAPPPPPLFPLSNFFRAGAASGARIFKP